jgi:hypothetical protein
VSASRIRFQLHRIDLICHLSQVRYRTRIQRSGCRTIYGEPMIQPTFPKRRADQSFVIVARFTTSNLETIALVTDYLKAWTRANRIWYRIWRSDRIEEERLEFSSEFFSEPRIESGADVASFSIILEGRPTAARWKDWVVLLVDDVQRLFPEVKFDRFES